jgi:hypothetical protein
MVRYNHTRFVIILRTTIDNFFTKHYHSYV